MKKIVAILAMGLLAGCVTANCFVSESASPRKGEKMRLHFRTLKVVQVCDGYVHAIHHSYRGLRIAVIPLDNDYVTDSYLRPGLYEYVGPYTYETPNKQTNTIRLFKEVDDVE